MEDRGILGGLHPFVKLLLLVVVMLASLLVVMVFGVLAALPFRGEDLLRGFESGGADNLNLMRYFQLLSHLGLFVLSSLVFAWLVGGNLFTYLGINKSPGWYSLLLAGMIMLVALPLVSYLAKMNEHLSLPESLSRLEAWMRSSEDAARMLTKQFLEVSTFPGLMFNLFLIAILPAVGEEFIFRGALQRILHQWSGNAHIAVILAAVIFSAIHLQFYGFLPRLVLGMILGYMLVISGNIWIAVFGHFFNNAAAVLLFFWVHNYTDMDPEKFGSDSFGLLLVAFSLFAVLMLFRLLSKESKPLRWSGEKPPVQS